MLLQPVYQIGLPGRHVSNIEGSGASWITRGSMRIEGQVARISARGRGMICWMVAVHTPGIYHVRLLMQMEKGVARPDLTLHVGRFGAARRLAGSNMQLMQANHGKFDTSGVGIVRLEPVTRSLTEMCLSVHAGPVVIGSRTGNSTLKEAAAQAGPSELSRWF